MDLCRQEDIKSSIGIRNGLYVMHGICILSKPIQLPKRQVIVAGVLCRRFEEINNRDQNTFTPKMPGLLGRVTKQVLRRYIGEHWGSRDRVNASELSDLSRKASKGQSSVDTSTDNNVPRYRNTWVFHVDDLE